MDIPILGPVQGEMASWISVCSREASRVLRTNGVAWGEGPATTGVFQHLR